MLRLPSIFRHNRAHFWVNTFTNHWLADFDIDDHEHLDSYEVMSLLHLQNAGQLWQDICDAVKVPDFFYYFLFLSKTFSDLIAAEASSQNKALLMN